MYKVEELDEENADSALTEKSTENPKKTTDRKKSADELKNANN